LTGHTGFKGSWLALYLESLGAEVTGIALDPSSEPNLFGLLAPWSLNSRILDIRNKDELAEAVCSADPEIVIHMAAQALVLPSYRDPLGTFETNILGTANVLNALRDCQNLRAALIVTSDKVYENSGTQVAFKETDRLGGNDPYSASKAAAELVTRSMTSSYFTDAGVAVHAARAGNVIGGGDWSDGRLIPDLWRAIQFDQPVAIRHPNATRPWQFILEPLHGYLTYLDAAINKNAESQIPPALNFGPSAPVRITVSDIAEMFGARFGKSGCWYSESKNRYEESGYLAVDSRKAQECLGWSTVLSPQEMIDWTVAWYEAHAQGKNMRKFSLRQISDYAALAHS
jgi:CDP-glucose 4,6-dehydratase